MIRTIPNLERSIHKTNNWINEVNKRLEWQDEQKAYTALEGTLRMLRDMLTVDEATDFGSQLPMILRGAYYSNWKPSDTPIRTDKSTFVSRIHSHMGNDPDVIPDVTTQKIMQFLSTKMTNGELSDVRAQLPEDIQSLWEEQ